MNHNDNSATQSIASSGSSTLKFNEFLISLFSFIETLLDKIHR